MLKLACAVNKKGNQTLSVITKSDTLVAGFKSEAMYISLARNQDMRFCLGWHMLKNIDFKKKEWLLADHDVKKKEFFFQKI